MSAGCVWITGASSGIGLALAERMMRDGWAVAGSARSADALSALESKHQGKFFAYPLDVADEVAARDVVARIRQERGGLDMAVLAAGTHEPFEVEDFRTEVFGKLVGINLMGVVNCLAAVAPGFIGEKRGHIAVVSSVAGYGGLPTAAAYGATKAALNNMTASLKFDFDRHNVKLQLVCPGFVRTPLTDRNPFPMPFLMEPEDAADAFYRGLQSDRFEITFPRRFALILKLLNMLPYGLYFRLVQRGTGK
ncbi:SDR family NAD(P)-dependent oxidoreductase [Nisaea acidiphila]|uniref:SDR family NAD(P)-dependent oxidoreductase n=1 Tax=Nisaea acidiphila TaxID=1862145 RepID=A0A9J7AQT8_9PROT|nr:SDR family NAD(P)-dependent oxidoreductase [Nisaea acidiphila]UUX49752.1 SDR family NAD(P)-dependent oxidoreductase [Nisaea acidiphila]